MNEWPNVRYPLQKRNGRHLWAFDLHHVAITTRTGACVVSKLAGKVNSTCSFYLVRLYLLGALCGS